MKARLKRVDLQADVLHTDLDLTIKSLSGYGCQSMEYNPPLHFEAVAYRAGALKEAP